jgi:hypothetical protein
MELNTYGDLKKLIDSISKKKTGQKIIYKGGEIALDTALGFLGAGAAKNVFDLVKAGVSRPDDKKTKTWLDKLDIDDDMSAIVDDTVENGFIKIMSDKVKNQPDNKELEDDFNMNQELVNYLSDKYNERTVTGIKENKMKKTILEQLIREEIKNILELTPPTPTKDGGKIQGSFKPELFQKLMGKKFDQAEFISAMTKLKNNQSRSTNDNAFLGDLVRALMFTDDNKILTDIFTYLKTLKTV